MSKDDAWIVDLLHAGRRVLSYIEGITADAFCANEEKQSAVLYQLTVIGEAARRVSPVYCADHPEVDWVGMAGLRNRIIHEYDRVELDIVWHVISQEIGPLVTMLETFVREQA